MALTAIVSVKPALASKVNEKSIAANAMQMIGSFQGRLSKELEAFLMEKAMLGIMPRGLAEKGILDQGPSEQEMALAQQQAKNDAMALEQNQQAYEQNPTQYEVDNVMATRSPEEIDSVITGLNGQNADGYVDYQDMSRDISRSGGGPEVMDMVSQDGAMTTGDLSGFTPETGGEFANPNGLV